MSIPTDPTPALLVRLNRNINALGSAIDELQMWIAKQGSIDTAASIRAYLTVLEDNADPIAEGMAELIAQCATRGK